MSATATRRGARSRERILVLAVLAAVMVAAFVIVMHGGRDTTFWFDEWDFLTRRLEWRPHALLYPHNEHLSVVPVFVYKLLLETVGMDSYGVFRAVAALLDLLCGALFFAYLRPRVGDWLAVALAACLMLMGASAFDLVWPFQIGYLGSLAAGLGAFLALDHGTRRGDVAACVLLAVSLGSSSVGLPILVAGAADVLLRPGRRERWWIAAVPAALWGLWYLKYGTSGHASLSNVTHVPGEIFGGLSVSAAALAGFGADFGPPLAVLVAALVIADLVRPGPIRVRLVAIAALPLTFWVLAAIARPEWPPSEQRYLYPTGLFVGLLAAEALARVVPPVRVAAAAAAVLALGAAASATRIEPVGDEFRKNAAGTLPALTAADILGAEVLPPNALPDPNQPQLEYGRYRAAVAQYGSTPAWTPAELRDRGPGDRAAVDGVLVRLLAPRPEPGADAPAGCDRLSGGSDRELEVPASGLYVRAGSRALELRFRRFGDGFPDAAQATLEPHSAGVVGFPRDHADAPWRVALRSGSAYEACSA